MAIDTFVRNLRLITQPIEIDDILARMESYEREKGEECVVLLIQNTQLGELYRIMPLKEAEDSILNKGEAEWGVKYYSREHLGEWKNRLKDCKNMPIRGIVPIGELPAYSCSF